MTESAPAQPPPPDEHANGHSRPGEFAQGKIPNPTREGNKAKALTGSRAIKRLGEVLRSSSRTTDTPARYGGDEFIMMAGPCSVESEKQIMETAEAVAKAEAGAVAKAESRFAKPCAPKACE